MPSESGLGNALSFTSRAVVVALVLASAAPGSADERESPEAFLVRAYTPYLKNENAPPVTKREAALFEPSLRALFKKDRGEVHGEVGRIDGDVLCGCQDYETFKAFEIDTTHGDPDQPELLVRFLNGETPVEMQVLLRRTKAGWRIHDLVEREQGSVRKRLGATTEARTPPESTAYFYGPVVYTSAEGGRGVGNASSLVQRIVRPGSAEIEEYVLQPASQTGERAVDHVAKLRRIGDSAKFAAIDAESTFSGTMTFVGPEWAYTSWTYELVLSAGGTLVAPAPLGQPA